MQHGGRRCIAPLVSVAPSLLSVKGYFLIARPNSYETVAVYNRGL